MRNVDRIDKILFNLGVIWSRIPEQRFFQLLFNYTRLGTRTQHLGTIADPFHYEDEELLEQLEKVAKEFLKLDKRRDNANLEKKISKRK